jgi:hypothetical protein
MMHKWIGLLLALMGLTAMAQEVEIYRSKEPITSLEVDLLHVALQVVWVNQAELSVVLSGDGAREFRHKIRYHSNSGVLEVAEELALGQRVSEFWDNRDTLKEQPVSNLVMVIQVPRTFTHIPYRFKVLAGSLSLHGQGILLQGSLSIETVQGAILVERLQGSKLQAKSAQGAIKLEQVGFSFVDLQTVHGDIEVAWAGHSRIFLRVGQLAGGTSVNGKKERVGMQVASVGVFGQAKYPQMSELEIRTGYGRISLEL